MKYDARLLGAMKAYQRAIDRDGYASMNGEVPVSQEQYILRIARWSNKIAEPKENPELLEEA